MVNSGNPSKDRVTLRSCYSLHEASQKPNHRLNTLLPATFTGEIFRRPPFLPKSTPTGEPPSDLPSGGSLVGKYLPTRPQVPISGATLKFTIRRRVRHCLDTGLLQQVCLSPISPSIHSTHPTVVGKALLFHFFSPATVSTFFCCLNLLFFFVFSEALRHLQDLGSCFC